MIRTKFLKYSVSLNYIKYSFDRHRTMIVHHGLMGSSKNFRTISRHPNISNFVNSYLIDARNHGDSPKTQTHTMQDLADDLLEFITHHKQQNWNHITLLGHSMGGIALMEFTKKYPQMQQLIDRVILVDISSTKIDQDPNWNKTKQMLRNVNNISLDLPREEIDKKIDEYARTPAIAGLLKMDLISEDGKNYWKPNLSTLVKEYDHIGKYELRETEWKKPVEVIYGSLSNHVNTKEIQNYQKLYPQMGQDNFHRVEGAGHWVHSEKPKQFLQIMKSILLKDEL